MAHLMFVTWGGAGNQTPAIGLASALAARGHRVTFAGYPGQRETFEGFGFGFRVLPAAQHAWPLEPPDDWMTVLVDAVWACDAHLTDLPELVESEACDAVVVDCLMTGALAAAESLPVPTLVLVHSAPGALAPPGGGLDLLALARVNDVRARAGLDAVATLWETWRPFGTLCTSIRELDPLGDRLPGWLTFTGPIQAPYPPSGWRWPWPETDERPVVFASFSTGAAWDQSSRVRRTVEALDDGRHRLVALTGYADPTGVRPSADAAVLRFLPHSEALPRASAAVTHAGHGTVAAALAYGVPIVALPNPAADQPALAAQLEREGAGIALDGESASPAEIAAAVRTVLSEPDYAASAYRLGERIAAAPGLRGAADRVEALLATASPAGDRTG